MNCCDANSHCNQGPDCPAQAPRVPAKRRTCDELGVCHGIACQDCDAFECELPCSPEPAAGELYPWPRYPFAPGVIEGPTRPPVTRHGLLVDLVRLLACVGGVSLLVGYLLERFA